MKYEEAKPIFEQNELRALCVQTGLSVPEVIKRAIRTPEKEMELWNRAHTEAGTLTKIEKKDVEYGYQLIVTFIKQNPNPKFGGSEKENRSIFFNDEGATYERWNKLIGKRCLFYIGYSENKDDKSAFRNLLDVEEADRN